MNEKTLRTEKLINSVFEGEVNPHSGDNKEVVLLRNLVKQLSSGQQSALEQLYLMLYDSTVLFINRIVHSREDASDLTQDAFAYLWENREKLSEISNIKAYFFKIARTQAYRFIRKRAAEYSNVPLSNTIIPHIEDIISSDETRMLIMLMMEAMPEQRRKIIEMSRFEGLSNDEIAAKLGISNKTVRNNIHIGIKEIRDFLRLASFFMVNIIIN